MINFSAIKVRLSECVVKTLVTIDTKSLVLFTIDDDISVMQRSMCDICLCKDRAKIVKLTQWQSHGKSLNKVVNNILCAPNVHI